MTTGEAFAHSLVIASDYRVADPSRVWPLLQRRQAALADIGAHHVGVYTSTQDHGRVLVTIGVRNREPVVDLLRSRIFFDWFDAVGVDDIPAVFAGEKAAKFDLGTAAPPAPPDIVLAAIVSVDDVAAVIAAVHNPGADRGVAGGRTGRLRARHLRRERAQNRDSARRVGRGPARSRKRRGSSDRGVLQV